MKIAAAVLLVLSAVGSPALAQREPPLLRKVHLDLQQCLGRAEAHASAQPEATRDTVADYAAKQCEASYVRRTTRLKLMEPAQARIEVDVFAYQIAERILSH